MIRRGRALVPLLLLAALLIGLLPGAALAAETEYEPEYSTIRVGINTNSGYTYSLTPGVTLTNSGQLRLGTYDDDRVFTPWDGESYRKLSVAVVGDELAVTDLDENTRVYSGTEFALAPVDGAVTTTYALPGATYSDGQSTSFEFSGGFRFSLVDGRIQAVNYVELEAYVLGVVVQEMYGGWALAAYEAQALCARTYAAYAMERERYTGFDVSNTTTDQVYKGVVDSVDTTTQARAVRNTGGQYLLYDGALIDAVYHAADGGATEDSANVWSSDLDYLQGVDDEHESLPAEAQALINWTITLTAQEVHERMSAVSDYTLKDVASIDLVKTERGNIYSVTFTDSDGDTALYTKSECRTVVLSALSGGSAYTSQRFDITSTDASAATTSVMTGAEMAALADDGPLFDTGEPSTASDLEQLSQQAAEIVPPDSERDLETYAAGDVFTITNYGFGHNVGMSQYGAQSMAEKGMTSGQIIHFYYTGVTITGEDETVDPEPGPSELPFTDVATNQWYYEWIKYVYEQGLMTGASATTFEPDTALTRGMFITILGRMEEIDESTYQMTGALNTDNVNFRSGPGTNYDPIRLITDEGTRFTLVGTEVNSIGETWYKVILDGTEGYIRSDFVSVEDFTDLKPGEYYVAHVLWGVENDLITGYDENTFRPDATLTREDMCTLLYRYCAYKVIDLDRDTSMTPFTDMSDVSEYAQQAVTVMQQAGIINGLSDGVFGPTATSERSHVATLIARFHQQYA